MILRSEGTIINKLVCAPHKLHQAIIFQMSQNPFSEIFRARGGLFLPIISIHTYKTLGCSEILVSIQGGWGSKSTFNLRPYFCYDL